MDMCRKERAGERRQTYKGHITRGRYFKVNKVREYKCREYRNKLQHLPWNKGEKKATKKMVR
jgi:hypothetical protein